VKNIASSIRTNVLVYIAILFAGFILSHYFFSFIPKKSAPVLKFQEIPFVPGGESATPSAAPLRPQGVQTAGDYLLTFKDYSSLDSTIELHLTVRSTGGEKTLGNVSVYSPETSAAILSYPPRVVFLREFGGSKNEVYSPLNNALVVYSILSDTFSSTLTLADIKSRYPNLEIPRNATLNSLIVSPSGNRVAFNYGYPIEPDYGSDIFVVNLLNGKVVAISEKGKLKQWVNDVLLRYDVIDAASSKSSLDSFSSKVTRDVGVPY
jgi:hypothetical protein